MVEIEDDAPRPAPEPDSSLPSEAQLLAWLDRAVRRHDFHLAIVKQERQKANGKRKPGTKRYADASASRSKARDHALAIARKLADLHGAGPYAPEEGDDDEA